MAANKEDCGRFVIGRVRRSRDDYRDAQVYWAAFRNAKHSRVAFTSERRSDACANSVDPDETAHQDIYCLPFCFDF